MYNTLQPLFTKQDRVEYLAKKIGTQLENSNIEEYKNIHNLLFIDHYYNTNAISSFEITDTLLLEKMKKATEYKKLSAKYYTCQVEGFKFSFITAIESDPEIPFGNSVTFGV
jgi:hypothetical protein